eukprot:CAMPEP_0180315968 /NCGR_PEP_ID=MMETSP0988-20121125/32977_1 /TAXON_ID=697907 /ORGANISM="non described non described, Strain CCMP2293" /LENGTH=136 /DNA_ID=CAMNT_0022300973 /DNA_START=73 /DNA_END=480 /DNA_ORIENTATION=-
MARSRAFAGEQAERGPAAAAIGHLAPALFRLATRPLAAPGVADAADGLPPDPRGLEHLLAPGVTADRTLLCRHPSRCEKIHVLADADGSCVLDLVRFRTLHMPHDLGRRLFQREMDLGGPDLEGLDFLEILCPHSR